MIGALPGAGADIAAWVAYAIAKRRSKTPEAFGKGHDEGLIEAGAANNGALSSAWVPTLVFGIPGDSITAIVIGVLYLKGLEPGPIIFLKTPELVYANYHPWLRDLPMIPFRYGDYSSIRGRFMPGEYDAATGDWEVIASVTMEGDWTPADPAGEAIWMQALADATGCPAAHVAQAWLDDKDVEQVLVAIHHWPKDHT